MHHMWLQPVVYWIHNFVDWWLTDSLPSLTLGIETSVARLCIEDKFCRLVTSCLQYSWIQVVLLCIEDKFCRLVTLGKLAPKLDKRVVYWIHNFVDWWLHDYYRRDWLWPIYVVYWIHNFVDWWLNKSLIPIIEASCVLNTQFCRLVTISFLFSPTLQLCIEYTIL